MMDETSKEELIEQYLLGELKGEALADFKKQLAFDDSLRQEVAVEQAIYRNLKTVGRADWRLKLESFHQEIAEENKLTETVTAEQSTDGKVIKLNARRYFLMAAASVAFVIACTLTINTIRTNQNKPDAIYEAFFTPYNIETFRSATEASVKTKAIADYKTGNYQQSILLFQQVLGKEKDEKILFYLGNAYLAAERPQEAIQTFQTYLQQYQGFATDAKWYLSLSYLKVGNVKEAKKILEEIAANNSPDNDYQEKAKEILSKRLFKKLKE